MATRPFNLRTPTRIDVFCVRALCALVGLDIGVLCYAMMAGNGIRWALPTSVLVAVGISLLFWRLRPWKW